MKRKFKLSTFALNSMAFILLYACTAISSSAQQKSAQQFINQAAQAYGSQLSNGTIADWVGTGKISITGDTNGPLDFTLTVKGTNMVQRIVQTATGGMLRYGSDGKRSWQSSGQFSGDAVGRVEYFVESQTGRSIASLFANASKGYVLSDLGPTASSSVPGNSPSRVIQAQDGTGQTTRYYIDNATSLITRLEFDTGTFYTMPFDDKQYPVVAAYVFSNYQSVNGVMTPFKIETYLGLIKIEEMNFTSVQYNTGIADDMFVP